MNIGRAFAEAICSCDNIRNCDNPHSLFELEQAFPETYKQLLAEYEPPASCPKCNQPANVYILHGTTWCAYCVSCELDLDILEDGKIVIANTSLEETMTGKAEIKHVDASTLKCPKCSAAIDPDCIWDYAGVEEAYCDKCFTNFETVSGEVVDFDNDSGVAFELKDESKDKTQTGEKHHVLTWDNKLKKWICDTCEQYHTSDAKEATAHEKLLVSEIPHYYTADNRAGKPSGSQMCKFCKKTWPSWAEAKSHDNEAGQKANSLINTATYSGGYTGGYYTTPSCNHPPTAVINGSNDGGWSLSAGKRWDCEKKLNDFDVVLNLTGWRSDKRHDIPIPELVKWAEKPSSEHKYKEICLDWPDMGVVDLPKAFWVDFYKYIKKNSLKVVVYCVGGHGRTGTAIASMLVVALGWKPKQACKWVWDNYCEKAIETDAQVNYVYKLAGQTYTPPANKGATTKQNRPGHQNSDANKLIEDANNLIKESRHSQTQGAWRDW